MAKLSIVAGATSQSVNVFVRDSTSTTGGGLAAVAPAGGSLLSGTKLYYSFTGTHAAAGTAITLNVLATVGTAWNSAGAIVTIDGTNMIGWVRIDIPNAALAGTNGRVVSFLLFGGTNMAPTPFEIELTGTDNQDAVHGGMSALPNTACTTNASLMTSGTGTDQLSVTSGRIDIGKALGTAVTLDANNVINVSTKYLGGTLQTARDIGASVLLSAGTGSGQLDFTTGVVKCNATQWLGGTIPAVNVTGVPLVDMKYTLGTISPAQAGSVAADWSATTNKTATAALTGTTISTSQAVASVTGAVGSVTGSVGSVTAAVTLSAGDSPVMQSGTAAAGGASAITIATALGVDSLPVGCTIKITSGTGADQARVITAYVNATKVCTVDRAWTTAPDATSVYSILYGDSAALSSGLKVSEVVLCDTTTTLTNAPSDSSGVTTLLTRISGAITITSGGVLVHSVDTGGIAAASFAASAITSTVAPNLDAAVSSRMATYTQPTGFLAATFPAGTIANQTNITAASGVALSATGLDSISIADPGVAANLTTFPKIMVWLFRRFFAKATMTATQVKTLADDGTTVNVTQTVSDDGTTQTQGKGV